MLISSAKISEREGSTLLSSFYGRLSVCLSFCLLVTRVSLIYLIDVLLFVSGVAEQNKEAW